MKTKVILLMLICSTAIAQDKISINVAQDAKLLLFGDDKGNEAGTLNITIRTEWQGKQQKLGYMFVAPEFEYAGLQGGIYRRYSANVGYTFQLDRVFYARKLKGLQATSSVGVGTIDHNGGYYGLGANFQLSYEVLRNLFLFLDLQLVDRKDLQSYYSKKLDFSDRVRASGMVGIKFSL
tara:strand:+ start:85 stop:621 length:537 start_codon:yes stop_codon:yes gene_type:complete